VFGVSCRSLLSSGTCPGRCWRSAKAMLDRPLWSLCADRCDWDAMGMKAAASWFQLCIAHQAAEVDNEDFRDSGAAKNSVHAHFEDVQMNASDVEFTDRAFYSHRAMQTEPAWSVIPRQALYGGFVLLAVLSMLLASFKRADVLLSVNRRGRRAMKGFKRLLRRLRDPSSKWSLGRSAFSRGPWNSGVESRARRHLTETLASHSAQR